MFRDKTTSVSVLKSAHVTSPLLELDVSARRVLTSACISNLGDLKFFVKLGQTAEHLFLFLAKKEPQEFRMNETFFRFLPARSNPKECLTLRGFDFTCKE